MIHYVTRVFNFVYLNCYFFWFGKGFGRVRDEFVGLVEFRGRPKNSSEILRLAEPERLRNTPIDAFYHWKCIVPSEWWNYGQHFFIDKKQVAGYVER